MQYYIYKITNKLNGKAYVGQHKVYPGEHFMRYMGKGIAIRAAIQKYGKENFTKEILEEIEDDEKHELTSERERYWIAALNTMQPNGYNLSPGGEGGCTPEAAAKGLATKRANGNNKRSLETRRKMSEARIGIKFSDKHRQHLSDNHHLKKERTLLFEDGHTETTTDNITNIAKRFNTSPNTLLRHSAKKKFTNGVMIKNIEPGQYACFKNYDRHDKLCYDPIRKEICTYYALQGRKRTHPETYKDIRIKDHMLKQ